MSNPIKLAIGPILFYWSKDEVQNFYLQASDSPADIVYVGESVCSRRCQLRTSDWIGLAKDLAAAGKDVVLSALALAESLMEEITSAGFTFCQPQDPNFLSATNTAQCTPALVEKVGPDTFSGVLEARPYDNVNDYVDAFGTPKNIAATDLSSGIAAPAGYQASVTISELGIAGISATESLLVNVMVTGPDNTRISLDGFRTRHAPRVSP